MLEFLLSLHKMYLCFKRAFDLPGWSSPVVLYLLTLPATHSFQLLVNSRLLVLITEILNIIFTFSQYFYSVFKNRRIALTKSFYCFISLSAKVVYSLPSIVYFFNIHHNLTL